jgi:hypothetical protein
MMVRFPFGGGLKFQSSRFIDIDAGMQVNAGTSTRRTLFNTIVPLMEMDYQLISGEKWTVAK